MGGYRLDSCGVGLGPVVGCYEYCSDPSGSVKCWEFVDCVGVSSSSLRHVARWLRICGVKHQSRCQSVKLGLTKRFNAANL